MKVAKLLFAYLVLRSVWRVGRSGGNVLLENGRIVLVANGFDMIVVGWSSTDLEL